MKKTLLVVDDELSIRMLLEHFLGSDYNVVTHENGKHAYEWLNNGNQPDLILADLEMPVLDGFELLTKVHSNKNTSTIPYMIVSGKNKTENYMKSFRMGAIDFLQKPFTPEELTSRVKTILKERRPE